MKTWQLQLQKELCELLAMNTVSVIFEHKIGIIYIGMRIHMDTQTQQQGYEFCLGEM